MRLSKKCQYALRAVFELAFRNSDRPVTVQDIAEAQNIPPRFLEIILSQLRQAGIVESQRGNEGGYLLARRPQDVTTGEIIEFVEGPLLPVVDRPGKPRSGNAVRGDYALGKLWSSISRAVKDIHDQTTINDLVVQETAHLQAGVPNYAI